MELFTIQLAKWREAKRLAIPLIDTTVKSGDARLAPTWNLVTRIKAGAITEEQYVQEYLDLMRISYKQHTPRWLEIASMERVALACYCPANCFCHRQILVDLFEKVCTRHGIPFKYSGELT